MLFITISVTVDYAVMRAAQIQKAIAESYAEYMAGRSYVYNVAQNIDLKSYGNGLDADGVKLYCGSMAKRIADRAIQVDSFIF